MKITGGWCGMERLEDRQLLAGDVTVQVVNGVLRITGDAAANEIRVEEGSSHNFTSFLVSGVDTTLNGESAPVELEGASGGIRIDLQGGNDRLFIPGGTN